MCFFFVSRKTGLLLNNILAAIGAVPFRSMFDLPGYLAVGKETA